MKITKPAEEIEVCDICRHDGYLQQCVFCARDYCLTCKALIYACWVEARVCEKCGEIDEVGELVRRFSKDITPIIKARRMALLAMGGAQALAQWLRWTLQGE